MLLLKFYAFKLKKFVLQCFVTLEIFLDVEKYFVPTNSNNECFLAQTNCNQFTEQSLRKEIG